MPHPSLAPNDLLIFLIGRPGAGKSTFGHYLARAIASTRVLSINDYDLLLARAKQLPSSKIRWESNGQFEVLDRSLFDSLLDEIVTAVNAHRGKRPTIVEFSRPAYLEAFAKLTTLSAHPFLIIYIDVPLETCLQRNASRAPDYPIKTIPEGVIRAHYATDDLGALTVAYPGRVRVVQNDSGSLRELEREANLVLETLVGAINVKALRPIHPLRREITVACLLGGYLAAFAGLAVWAWKAPTSGVLTYLAGADDRLQFLRTLLYVAAAGGLGSTTYCIRAFYHYYIQGVFDFGRFKWWYLFRPLAGPVLALASYAVVQGGVVALGTGISGSANETWFGVAYLAGFGTEQVIEWLRRASKAIFGESRVQPETDGR